jgi:hypothetical protein
MKFTSQTLSWVTILLVIVITNLPRYPILSAPNRGIITCNTAQSAIKSGLAQCATQASNSLCVGFNAVTVTKTDNSQQLLTQSGTAQPLPDLQTIKTSALNLTQDQYGVALVKASLTDERGVNYRQPLTLMLYGDARLTKAPPQRRTNNAGRAICTGTVTQATTLRTAFNEAAKPDNPSVAIGDKLQVAGRSADGQWIYAESTKSGGWIPSQAISLSCTAKDLIEIDVRVSAYADALPGWTLETIESTQQAACQDIPNSGLLMQAPLSRSTQVQVNGATILFNGTMILSAETNGDLRASLLEGAATLTSVGVSTPLVNTQNTLIPLGGAGGLTVIGSPDSPISFASASGETIPNLRLRTLCDLGKSVDLLIPCRANTLNTAVPDTPGPKLTPAVTRPY